VKVGEQRAGTGDSPTLLARCPLVFTTVGPPLQ
jgi:hypothetical protein